MVSSCCGFRIKSQAMKARGKFELSTTLINSTASPSFYVSEDIMKANAEGTQEDGSIYFARSGK
ncbi:hypothetical protein OK016_04860 [Vibrio chagasii]|nr:hypothetical protein [Vibrio chagasii]